MLHTITSLPFDNTYARLPELLFSSVTPARVSRPHMVSFNADAAALIDLDPTEATRADLAEYLSGNQLIPGSQPIAAVYSGHQFGVYVPQLGDGRAILLGEVRNSRGEKWDIQLKGAGQTPYSRMGDGRAVLRSTIREYLCSEAMHHLGIPTTRALAIVGTPDAVHRETVETGAILTRLAPSHIRFGTFEFLCHTGKHGELRVLADHTVNHHFPHLREEERRVARMFREVVVSTARLIAKWQAAGWAHGVMNTDNMSVHGITLDYGPFGFMDAFDPGFIPNHSDPMGRYAFDQQPSIGFWNLRCFAAALLPLMTREEAMEGLDAYQPAFLEHFDDLMRSKLGLRQSLAGDRELAVDLLALMHADGADHTNTFRELATVEMRRDRQAMRDAFRDREAFDAWATRYCQRLQAEGSADEERRSAMNAVNPKYVLRNYLVQTAIERAQRGDFSEVDRLLDLLRRPFGEQPGMEAYAAPPPDWGRHLVVSCSS